MADSDFERLPPPPQRRYLTAPVPVHFPVHEFVPQTEVHMRLRTELWCTLRREFADRAVVGSNQFLYWNAMDPTQRLAPDLTLRLGASRRPLTCWKVWERGAPHLAVEIISAEDERDRDWTRNFELYRRVGVRELVRFDPEHAQSPLRLWDSVEDDLVEREISKDELERSGVLGLYWNVERDPVLGLALRLSRDSAGKDRIILNAEEALRAVVEPRCAAEASTDETKARISELARTPKD